MPFYTYKCTKCKKIIDLFKSMHDKHYITCPHCNTETLEHIFSVPLIRNSEPKTIGSLAEQNSKKMGKELIDIKKEEFKTKRI